MCVELEEMGVDEGTLYMVVRNIYLLLCSLKVVKGGRAEQFTRK